jgi:hypothetical protein
MKMLRNLAVSVIRILGKNWNSRITESNKEAAKKEMRWKTLEKHDSIRAARLDQQIGKGTTLVVPQPVHKMAAL